MPVAALPFAPHSSRPGESGSALLRYRVEIKQRTSRRTGNIGSSPAITPRPLLGPFAPFPYGTAPVPRSWEPISQRPVYLSVPSLYDSDKADQVGKTPIKNEVHESCGMT